MDKEKQRARYKKYYQKNREKIKENFLLKYKLGKYCSFCGYNEHPEILQFHHKNRKDKSFRISEFRRTPNLLLLNEEINKCILLCPNCHYLFHLKERKKEID